jgi:hypothetical protein
MVNITVISESTILEKNLLKIVYAGSSKMICETFFPVVLTMLPCTPVPVACFQSSILFICTLTSCRKNPLHFFNFVPNVN